MKRKAGRNYQEERKQEPDCCVCIHRKKCKRYQEGSFCTMFHGRDPEPEGPDPNQAWIHGEEADF